MTHTKPKRVRYAVVGAGHIAQVAVLPAFAHAENSELVAIVSDDATKRRELGERYNLEQTVDYDDYEDLLARGEVDAVYICLPNNLHHEFVIRAANAGVHVLCEKPLAVTEQECREMIDATEKVGVKLMTAYRLHFEKANLKAIQIVNSGRIGEPRLFNSVFTQQIRPGDIRLQRELGGGTLYDIGIYCINAARYLFKAEPDGVQAWCVRGSDERFQETEETASAILHFPEDRLATFTCSFGAAAAGYYQIVGTEGDLCVKPAYHYTDSLKHELTIGDKVTRRTFRASDQFAPELIHFSKCILQNKTPEPSGEEGLADVRIIEALYRASDSNQRVELSPYERRQRPDLRLAIHRPRVKKPKLVHAESPSTS